MNFAAPTEEKATSLSLFDSSESRSSTVSAAIGVGLVARLVNVTLADVMSGKRKPEEEEYNVTYSQDPLSQEIVPRVSFKKGVTPERRKEIIADVFGTNAPSAAPKPAPGAPAQPVQPQPISIPGYTLKVK